MATDLAALFDAVSRAAASAPDASSGWRNVVAAVEATGHPVPAAVRGADIEAECRAVGAQAARLLEGEAPPPGLTSLYAALCTTVDPVTWREAAALRLAGGGTPDPAVAVAEGDLAYQPDEAYVDSALLTAVHEAAAALGDEYNVFDYGLMLGAGALLIRFGVGPHADGRALFVGFDSGDYLRVDNGVAPT
jgi:hypothetical protein